MGYNDHSKHSASGRIIKCYYTLFIKDAFVLSISSCWNTAFDSLFVRGVTTKPRPNAEEALDWCGSKRCTTQGHCALCLRCCS